MNSREAEREHDLPDAAFRNAQMPLEQALSSETQQALGYLLIFRLLETLSPAGGKNDGTHRLVP